MNKTKLLHKIDAISNNSENQCQFGVIYKQTQKANFIHS